MSVEGFVQELRSTWEFFNRSSACLEEKDSEFRPFEESATVAQQVAHVGQCVNRFMEGAFREEGFSLDFEAAHQEVTKVATLAEARAWVDRAFASAIETIASKSFEDMLVPLPEGPIMGGAPRLAIIGAIVDHTAHHRGVLAVCSRLVGHTPKMPYSDEEM
jgi:uncharacterized damage-inducible protein DinB